MNEMSEKDAKFLADFERKKKLVEWAGRERTSRLIETYIQAFEKGGQEAAEKALKEEIDRIYPETKLSQL